MKKTATSPKKLSFLAIYFLGINGIIGSGAFLLPKEMYQDMNLLSVVVLIFAAVTVSLIALCYADLSSRFDASGAAWVYSYNAFGRFAGYELGVFIWFLGCCTYSAEVVALLTTLKSFWPAYRDPSVYFSTGLGLIILFGIINFFGRSLMKFVDNISSAAKLFTIIFFILIGFFFIDHTNFSYIMPAAAHGAQPFIKHFGNAFNVVFYFFTGFSFIPIAAREMQNPEKNIPRVLIAVMITVTILYSLMILIAIGIIGPRMATSTTPIATAFKVAVGNWGYIVILIGMILSIFGVAFACSFNTPALLASLAVEHNLVPAWLGQKNKYDAPWISIIISSIVTAFLITQSYVFLVSCIVFASFVQYVPTIVAVMKFQYTGEYPTHGFKLPGGYTIPILALIVSCYLVYSFTLKTVTVGVLVAFAALLAYLFDGKKRMQRSEQNKTAPAPKNPNSSAKKKPASAKKARHHFYHIF